MTDVMLFDGGMGQELVHRAGDKPTPLWSTQVMMDKPGLVADVSRDFFAAGSTVATLNSYAIQRDRLVPVGIEDQFDTLHSMALKEGQDAVTAHGSGRLAGSMGPLAASYRPDIHPSADIAVPLYTEVAQKFVGNVDLIVCETVVSLEHTRCILEGAKLLIFRFIVPSRSAMKTAANCAPANLCLKQRRLPKIWASQQ